MSFRILGLVLAFALTEALGSESPPTSKETRVSLNSQSVIETALRQAPRLVQARFQKERAEAQAETILGVYDLVMNLAPTYEYTRAQNLTGFANRSDRTATVIASASKRLSTGSQVTAQYQSIQQESELNPFFSNLRPSRAASSVVSLQVRQSLWRNLFGESDRAVRTASDTQKLVAELSEEEAAEQVIFEAVSAYWNAVTAAVQFKESVQARDKFKELVQNVRARSGFSLTSPGEVPRLEAELSALEIRVRLSEQESKTQLENLKTILKFDSASEVAVEESEIAQVIESAEKFTVSEHSPQKLRPVEIARLQLALAEQNRKIAESNSRARVDLLFEARTTGVQQSTDVAFSQMTDGNFPTYIVGLQLEIPWDSSAFRGAKAEANASYRNAETEYSFVQSQTRDRLAQSERAFVASKESAALSTAIVRQRQAALRELERSYRQGRSPLIELIRAYNEFFQAVQDQARAVGQLQISTVNARAVRDEVVPSRSL